jgi:hypothetical protein
MVVAQIHRNERGSPRIPHTVLIDAVWVDSKRGINPTDNEILPATSTKAARTF